MSSETKNQQLFEEGDIIPRSQIFKVGSLACFFAFFLAVSFCVTGLVSPQIANNFGIDVSHIVRIDVLTVIGIAIGCGFSGKILQKLGCRKVLIILAIALFCAQILIALQNSLILYGVGVAITGFLIGLGTTTLTFLIVAAYKALQKSDAKLTFMNFFQAAGGILGSSLFGFVVFHSDWRWGFVTSGIIYLIIGIVVLAIKFDEKLDSQIENKEEGKKLVKEKSITLGVVLVALALVSYVYIEYIVDYWWSPILQLNLHYNIQTVGFVMSVWAGSLAGGRLFFGNFVLAKMKSHKFLYSAGVAIIITYLAFLCFHSNLALVFILTAAIGVSCSAVSPTAFSFGLKQTKNLSTITTAFLATAGTLGGISSMLVSSSVSIDFHNRLALVYLGPIVCIIFLFFIFMAERYRKAHLGDNKDNA